MLYVAKYAGADVIVVDSETGKTMRQSRVQLAELCKDNEVGGVLFDDVDIMAVIPYQHRNAKSALQTKTSLLKHVDVITYRNDITNIHIHVDKIKEPVTIRLSDYGEWCADYLLSGNRWSKRHVVTIILDDNICFTDLSFGIHNFLRGEKLPVRWQDLGVQIDLREVSSGSAARRVYQAAAVDKRHINGFISIVDKAERKRAMVQTIEERWRDWVGVTGR